MNAFFAPLLLLLTADTAALDLPRSELLPEGQRHDWSVAVHVHEGDGVVLIDNSDMPAYSDDTGTYPTVLIRGTEPYRNGSYYFVDFLVAIDCDHSMFAVTEVWEPRPPNGASKWGHNGLGVFVQANDKADEEGLTAIFTHVCGPEWKFEAG